MGAVAGMGPHVELKKRPAPRVAIRAEIDFKPTDIRLFFHTALTREAA